MKAFLILEDGHVFKGTSIGSTRDVISEIVFNTSMTGYLEVMTDPSYAGQAVCMTYPLIGNYGICYDDQESSKPWVDGFIVRELSRVPSNFRSVDTIQHFLTKHDIPGIAGIDTRALTKILREKGTMNGMITVNENYDLDTIIPQLKAYTTGKVVEKVTCREKEILKGDGPKAAFGYVFKTFCHLEEFLWIVVTLHQFDRMFKFHGIYQSGNFVDSFLVFFFRVDVWVVVEYCDVEIF